jgi:hypothetical protein
LIFLSGDRRVTRQLFHSSPTFRPSFFVQCRWLEVVIKHGKLNRLLPRRRLSQHGSRPVFLDAINVAAFDHKRFVRKSDHAFDVVGRWLFRILKDRNIPPLRVTELVRKFVDQNPIAFKYRSVPNIVFESAVRADRRFNSLIRTEIAGLVINLVAGSDQNVVAALLAVGLFVPTVKRRRHRPSRNDKCFCFETAEQKRQHKRHDDRLDRFAPAVLFDRLLVLRPAAIRVGFLTGRFRRIVFLRLGLPGRVVF